MTVKPFSNPNVTGTAIGEYFQTPDSLIVAQIVAVSVNAPILVDLFLDILAFQKVQKDKLDDRVERAMLALILIVPGIFILSYQSSQNFPHFYACMFSIQRIGSCVPAYSLCLRLVPEHFTPCKIVLSFVGWAFSSTGSLFNFTGPHSLVWPDALSVFTWVISQGLLSSMLLPWAKTLYQRAESPSSGIMMKTIMCMTDDEFSLLLYLIFVYAFSFGAHSLVGLTAELSWRNCGVGQILGGIYLLAGFSVVTGVVPNRIIQKIASKQEKQLDTNHIIVRYISHEIRSPMNIIQNGIRLVIDELTGCCHPDIFETLNDIQQASNAASTIVDDLLNFEQIKTGSFHVHQKNEPAALCLSRIAKRCQTLAVPKGIRVFIYDHLKQSQPGFTWAINVDATRLEQAMQSLIANSIKFSPADGSISITFSHASQKKLPPKDFRRRSIVRKCSSNSSMLRLPRPSGSKVPVCIKQSKVYSDRCSHDSENGMNQPSRSQYESGEEKINEAIIIEINCTGTRTNRQRLDQIFDEFSAFDAQALQGGGGSGLGLWICKEIIKQHKSELTVTSSAEEGQITIALKLDCFACEAERMNFQENTQNIHQQINILQTANTQDTNNPFTIQHLVQKSEIKITEMVRDCVKYMHILVADDIPLNRKILLKMLKKIESSFEQQYSVRFVCKEADDGVTAIQQVNGYVDNFDIIFLDNIMLSMNGPETAQQLRQEHHFTGNIIGVTGNALEVDISDFLLHGADKILIKPVSNELLCPVLLDLVFKKWWSTSKH